MKAAAALAAAASVGLFPAAASAATGPCLLDSAAGPKCHVWTGTVGPVDDGDTINVRIDGQRRLWKIRLTGIQAMELHSYSRKQGRSGECNAVKATERLERLIRAGNSRVRLAAIDPSSKTGERNRLRRSVAVRRGKRWVDVGAILIREGLALWFPNGTEWAWNHSYSRLAEQAARRGHNVWDPRACGRGPEQESPLDIKVKWDAEGTDGQDLNAEWVRISNRDPVNAVSLDEWWFRDSHLRRYTFPADAVVPAGGSIKLHVGAGKDTPDDFYWGLEETVFENATDDEHQIGDGGYLFDPEGDLRAASQYPCRTSCSEPLAGKVAVTATPSGSEIVTIRNTSGGTVDLEGYELESSPWFYEFGPGSEIGPGEALRVWVMAAPLGDSRLIRSWRFASFLLADAGDVVTLRNPSGGPVACAAWGGIECPAI